MRRYLSLVLALAITVSGLSGCASKYGAQTTVVNYYPACYRPIQDLRDRENDVAKGTAGGAFVGALGGALLGLLVSGGKWQGAVVGAAAGGATGAVAGNIYASKQQQRDDNIRLASYLQELDGDISRMDVATAAARTSLQCYNQQFKVLVSEIRAKKITRPAAQQRFSEISAGREEAINILGNTASRGENLAVQYENAFMAEEREMQSPQQIARGNGPTTKKVSTLRQARQRNRTIAQKTRQAATEKVQAQEESVRQISQMNALMNASDLLEDART